jgi:hypothetical protein
VTFQYLLFGLSVVSLLTGVAVWGTKLEPLRHHRGESGVRPDRYGEFLSAEWYKPEASKWLTVVRTAWMVAGLAFIAGILVGLISSAA